VAGKIRGAGTAFSDSLEGSGRMHQD